MVFFGSHEPLPQEFSLIFVRLWVYSVDNSKIGKALRLINATSEIFGAAHQMHYVAEHPLCEQRQKGEQLTPTQKVHQIPLTI
ncbi:MAG: hypothetical protein PUK59_04305 [Actinomycetaceae bacterium]|nr:hypothetical protein [Actinomycetaceae bacterium]MDY5855229.1 hypothetical protein [Arcanobacterium sp.]